MARIERFGAYAAAFEQAYAAGDWAGLAPFFTEDAVYDAGLPGLLAGRFEGRDAILAGFARVTSGFDKRFASRHVEVLDGPREQDDAVWVKGRATYRAEGVPDLVFELEETARFAGDRIRHLADVYPVEERARIEAYVARHGAQLGLETGDA